jgi:hypothetical protein
MLTLGGNIKQRSASLETYLLSFSYRLGVQYRLSERDPDCLPAKGRVNAQQLCHVTMTSSVEEELPTVSRCQAMREDGHTSRTHEHYNTTHMLVDYID